MASQFRPPPAFVFFLSFFSCYFLRNCIYSFLKVEIVMIGWFTWRDYRMWFQWGLGANFKNSIIILLETFQSKLWYFFLKIYLIPFLSMLRQLAQSFIHQNYLALCVLFCVWMNCYCFYLLPLGFARRYLVADRHFVASVSEEEHLCLEPTVARKRNICTKSFCPYLIPSVPNSSPNKIK